MNTAPASLWICNHALSGPYWLAEIDDLTILRQSADSRLVEMLALTPRAVTIYGRFVPLHTPLDEDGLARLEKTGLFHFPEEAASKIRWDLFRSNDPVITLPIVSAWWNIDPGAFLPMVAVRSSVPIFANREQAARIATLLEHTPYTTGYSL